MNTYGEDWKSDSLTRADVFKYKSTKAKLLFETDYHACPIQGTINEIALGGDCFTIVGEATIWGPNSGFWARREAVRVIAMLDKPQPIERVKQPEQMTIEEATKIAADSLLQDDNVFPYGMGNVTSRATGFQFTAAEKPKSRWRKIIDKLKRK
jgi:hypothetical protein